MEEKKVWLFIIIGNLLLLLDLLDISGGYLAIATSRSIPKAILFLIVLAILCCAVALTLSFNPGRAGTPEDRAIMERWYGILYP